MSYLYISEQGSVLSVDGGYFVVKYKDDVSYRLPKETLESAVLFGNISVTTPCVRELLKKGIPVNYFSEKGSYYGRLSSTQHKNIKRLKKQIYSSDSEQFCLMFAKKIISAKISNQTVVLRRYAANDHIVLDDIKNMGYYKEKAQNALSVEELIGYEGAAAKHYFFGLSKIVNKDFAFKNRNRMPPKDPFNSMLSLGYTLLMYEIYGEIENKGLTPYGGFLHKDHERHPTLASDLMEEWRAVIVDSVVMSLVQGNEMKATQFTSDDKTGGVFLTKDAMKTFLQKYELKMRTENRYIDNMSMSFRKGIRHQVNTLTNAIENGDPEMYTPIIIR